MACLSCLAPSVKEHYCVKCRKLLFDGHKVSSVLSFSKPEYTLIQRDQQTRLSISGVQNKISLTLEEGRLVPTDANGMYILKPAILEHHYPHASPANEHITMQIATQVYKYPVAANALIRFSDGELAYITRRFDRVNDSTKLAQEDFCQLLQKSSDLGGQNYKYTGAYEDARAIFEKYVTAPIPMMESYFKYIVLNYLYHNGDAHFKNFSLYFKEMRYQLTPLYDLMNTRLHIPNEHALAMSEGLYHGDLHTPAYQANGFYSLYHFRELAKKLGIQDKRALTFIVALLKGVPQAKDLIEHSYLENALKETYCKLLDDRSRALENQSFIV